MQHFPSWLMFPLMLPLGAAACWLGIALVRLDGRRPPLAWLGLAALAAVLASALPQVAEGGGPAIDALLLFLLLALAAADAYRYILPDVLTLGLLGIGLAVAFAGLGPLSLTDAATGALAGGGGLYAISAIYRRWRGREGVGLGDVKLIAAGGAWIGWAGLPGAVLVAALAGLIFALLLGLLRRRPLRAGTRLPFGVFLTLGIWVAWRLGPLSFL
ncbi:MAG: prepilin peptidase [Alphaproteobacteria bacterium]|nr:prepilin peptidase [Alphaproteobacteria bacterium]